MASAWEPDDVKETRLWANRPTDGRSCRVPFSDEIEIRVSTERGITLSLWTIMLPEEELKLFQFPELKDHGIKYTDFFPIPDPKPHEFFTPGSFLLAEPWPRIWWSVTHP